MHSRWLVGPVILAAAACAVDDRSESASRSRSRAEADQSGADAGAAAPAAGTCVRAVDLGTFGGNATVTDINERGEVVGYETMADGSVRAFYWNGASFREIAWPGRNTRAAAINERGEIAITTSVPGEERAYLWREGVFVDLGTLGASRTSATGINDAGEVIGLSYVDESAGRAFHWRDGVMTNLGVINGDVSVPTSINGRGQVLVESVIDTPEPRTHAFLWDEGTVTDFNPLAPAEAYSRPVGLTEGGSVLLRAAMDYQSPEESYLWRGGAYTRIVAFDGTFRILPYALNDREEIVGNAYKDEPSGQLARAFLWRAGVTTEILSPGGQAERPYPRHINASAQVAGDTDYPLTGGLPRTFTWKDGVWLYLDAAQSETSDMNDRGLVAGVVGADGSRRARIWDTTRCFQGGTNEPPPDAGSSSGGTGDGGKAW